MFRVISCLLLSAFFTVASSPSLEATTVTFDAAALALTSLGNTDTPPGEDDRLLLDAFSASLDLTIGVAVDADVNPFTFIVGDTGPGSDLGPVVFFDVFREFTVNGIVGTITQQGSLDVGFDGDTLDIAAGPTVTFDLGADGILSVTPLANPFGFGDVDTHHGTLQARFLLEAQGPTGAATPEPASLVLLGSGLAGAGMRRWRTRRLSASTSRASR